MPPPTLAGRADWTTLTFPTNTLIASQTWLPAITVPAGFAPEGAPVGLELVGKPYDEGTLLRLRVRVRAGDGPPARALTAAPPSTRSTIRSVARP